MKPPRSAEEEKAHLEERRLRREKLKKSRATAIHLGRRAGSLTKKVAQRTTKTAAKGAKKTQVYVVNSVHQVMGSDEYKSKAMDVNSRLDNVVQSLEDSITRRNVEIERLRKRVAELEAAFGRG